MDNENLKDYLYSNFDISHNGHPEVCWQFQDGGFMHLEFMMQDHGCWAVLSKRESGEEADRINLGTYRDADKIDELIRALKQGE